MARTNVAPLRHITAISISSQYHRLSQHTIPLTYYGLKLVKLKWYQPSVCAKLIVSTPMSTNVLYHKLFSAKTVSSTVIQIKSIDSPCSAPKWTASTQAQHSERINCLCATGRQQYLLCYCEAQALISPKLVTQTASCWLNHCICWPWGIVFTMETFVFAISFLHYRIHIRPNTDGNFVEIYIVPRCH
jgi:hypothetical protein